MPIVIEHGGQAGPAAGQIIAQAGLENLQRQVQMQMQMDAIDAQRQAQQAQIAAQAQAQERAVANEMDRLTYAAGLQGVAQERQFQQQLELNRQQAQERANQWKFEYTTRQRNEMAKRNEARRRIMESEDFTPEEKLQISRQMDMLDALEHPSMIPKTSNELMFDQLAEQGRAPGTPYRGEDGSWFTTVIGSSGLPEAKLLVRYDQSPEAQQQKLQIERENQLAKTRLQLMQATTRDPISGEESPRYRPAEIEVMLEAAYPWYKRERLQADIEQTVKDQLEAAGIQDLQQRQLQLERQAQQQREAPEWVKDFQKGDYLEPGDLDLPKDVAGAQALLRFVQDRYGGKVPGGMKDLAIQAKIAARIVREYVERAKQGEAEPEQATARQRPSAQRNLGAWPEISIP